MADGAICFFEGNGYGANGGQRREGLAGAAQAPAGEAPGEAATAGAGRRLAAGRAVGPVAKTVQTKVGPVPLQVPRDRAGSFEPLLVPKRAGRVSGGQEHSGAGAEELRHCVGRGHAGVSL